MSILEVKNLKKSFGKVSVLKGIDFSLEKGEVLAIIGSSGGGKTTLLRCLNFLEYADEGTISVGGEVIYEGGVTNRYNEAEIRKNRLHFGLVFQSFNLFPQYNVLRNVTLAPELLKIGTAAEIKKHALATIERVGLTDKLENYPCQLSGGQQQRVAIGRALITKPKLILADEPTGNLDSKNSQDVITLLTQASRRYQQTILMITHNKNLTASVDRVFRVSDGVLTDLGGKTNEALS